MQNLLSFQSVGGVIVFLLFAVIFIIVHVVKLARLGWLLQGKEKPREQAPVPQAKPQEKEKTDDSQKPQPIYYIVERKKRPPKRNYHYDEPKSIRFE